MIDLGYSIPADPIYASPVVTEFITPVGIPAEDIRNYYRNAHNIMVGRGSRTDGNGTVISFRIAHFGLAAEAERIDLMINVTREYCEKRG